MEKVVYQKEKNMDKEIIYKYFVAEGKKIVPVLETAKKESLAHQQRFGVLLKKYGADCTWGGRLSGAVALGYIWTPPEYSYMVKPDMRENFLKPTVERQGDVCYACYKPDQRRKAGKVIKTELESLGVFNYSEYLSKATGVDRLVFGLIDGELRMCRTTCGIYKDMLVFRIPVGGDYGNDFTPPEGLNRFS